MKFEKTLRVRFGHADPARIVYYPRFFEWFHDAFEDFFEAAFGLPYAQILEERRIGFPTVQVASEFRSPARFGELVLLEVFISRLTDSSATFEYRVRQSTRLLATASVKVVGMNMDEHTALAFPDDIRAGLAFYVEADDQGPDSNRLRD